MEITTTIKYVRTSPNKVNRVIKEIVGKKVNEALLTLEYMPQKSARILSKALLSAKSNAVNNYQMTEDNLIIKEGWVGQAMILKRFRAMSRGRAGRIQKKLSHVSIKLGEGSN